MATTPNRLSEQPPIDHETEWGKAARDRATAEKSAKKKPDPGGSGFFPMRIEPFEPDGQTDPRERYDP